MARPRKPAEIVAAFQRARVLTLHELVERLRLSRATVARRLSEHGYYSSYNQRGKFLTVNEVAEFDPRGLWAWKTARFSRHGGLLETAEHFIEASDCGMTHEELSAVLGLRLHNSLLELVRRGRVHREQIGPTFVYLSPRTRVRRQQIRRRCSLLEEQQRAQPTSQQVIAILLELIRDPKASRDEIAERCRRAGTKLTRAVVDATFEAYDLDKKRAP